jgi:hypothetical protein
VRKTKSHVRGSGSGRDVGSRLVGGQMGIQRDTDRQSVRGWVGSWVCTSATFRNSVVSINYGFFD